jgi:hypothetical protein
MNLQQRNTEETKLLKRIASDRPSLNELLRVCSDHWGYEDPIYRFYHQSFKVYYLQESTKRIVKALQDLAPHLPLNAWFTEIVRAGTGKEFSLEDNKDWTPVTRPIVEAFLHAKFFLEMACKYGNELRSPPQALPSGWAALLYLYNLR